MHDKEKVMQQSFVTAEDLVHDMEGMMQQTHIAAEDLVHDMENMMQQSCVTAEEPVPDIEKMMLLEMRQKWPIIMAEPQDEDWPGQNPTAAIQTDMPLVASEKLLPVPILRTVERFYAFMMVCAAQSLCPYLYSPIMAHIHHHPHHQVLICQAGAHVQCPFALSSAGDSFGHE